MAINRHTLIDPVSLIAGEHEAYHLIMDETYLQCPGSGPADHSIAADVLLRDEPDEEEEEDEDEHDSNEEDDDGDEGYSE